MRSRRAAVYWTGFAVILMLLIVGPLVVPEFWRRFLTEILIWGLLAMSSDILIGYTAMVSFGHSAFFGLGMYVAAAVAAFVAYFSTRLRDIYFAITTLIFSQIFYVIIFTWTEVTGGENGLTFSRPPLAIPGLLSVRFTSQRLHWFVLAVVTLSYLILRRITQSPFGMVLQSIRENEARTRAIGYPIERYKIVAVMLSGLFAGLAGVLYALQNRFAAPDFVFFTVSGEVVIQRHRHRHPGRADRRCRILSADARGFLAIFYRILPHSVGAHLYRCGHLHASGVLGFARRWLNE
jgi:branched-chain amino acid transport system permease protein